MGKLGDDMRRLVGEIDALREERYAYIAHLRTTVEQMRKSHRDEHARMAVELRAGLQGFIDDLAEARAAWFGNGRRPVPHLMEQDKLYAAVQDTSSRGKPKSKGKRIPQT